MAEIPYSFRDPALLDLALTHASANASKRAEADNERLEFLGDAALDLIVAEELFRRRAPAGEGELTELKSAVVSRRTLARAALALQLDRRAKLGGGLRGRTLTTSVLANLYEALLGAIYLDGGYAAARDFAMATLAAELERAVAESGSANPKQRLQELTQASSRSLPIYELKETRGSAHTRAFLVAVRIGDATFPSAWGRTRKEAERWAAYEALLVLRDSEG
jgi:ribonuclease-3